MKLITNRIHTGKAKSFEEIIKEYTEKQQVKTASVEEENVKVAEQEEAESSGQLDVEPLHQKGESTEMPKKGPSAKKEGVDGKTSSSSGGDPEKDGEDSGQPMAEKIDGKFVNKPEFDPNDIPKSEKGGSADEEVKEAASTCKKCKCEPCKCDEDKSCTASEGESETKEAQCEPKKDDEEKETKEAGKLPEALEEHKFTKKEEEKGAKAEEKEEKEAETKDDKKEEKEAKAEEKEEKEAKAEEKEEKEAETKDDEKEEKKEAEEKTEFVKLANLDAKNKAFLTEYWRQLFGEDYVNALVADK